MKKDNKSNGNKKKPKKNYDYNRNTKITSGNYPKKSGGGTAGASK